MCIGQIAASDWCVPNSTYLTFIRRGGFTSVRAFTTYTEHEHVQASAVATAAEAESVGTSSVISSFLQYLNELRQEQFFIDIHVEVCDSAMR